MKKNRIDEILLREGVVDNKKEAFILVTEGRIIVDGQKAVSPSQLVKLNSKIEVKAAEEFVGRGAYKLEAAIKKFKINPENKVVADFGSATGGFTQVWLKYGARKVYAIDTARGKLAIKIRENPQVVVMEGRDARSIEKLPDILDIISIDISLISLRDIIPHIKGLLVETGEVIALFKPQYETRDQKFLKRGIVKDSIIREKLLFDFIKWVKNNGWTVKDLFESPIKGSEGNTEYLLHLLF